MKYRHNKSRAFTLVEILTTVAIIGILLAVLIPALNQVGKKALVVKQKAQFHAIELAMEAFRSDMGDYPPSVFSADGSLYEGYTASHRLAEAIIGRDGLGFHPQSIYRSDGCNVVTLNNGTSAVSGLYLGLATPINPLWQNQEENVASRKGPYLEAESANAVSLASIFPSMDTTSLVDSFVLADSFKTRKHLLTGKKTGMPILYYRANPLRVTHQIEPPYNDLVFNASTYDVRDANYLLGRLGLDPLYPQWFYQRIWNRNFMNPRRPYRAETFILHSAGPDGLFGTADDVFNFDEEN